MIFFLTCSLLIPCKAIFAENFYMKVKVTYHIIQA